MFRVLNPPGVGTRWSRPELTVQQVAGMIEHRLHTEDLSTEQFLSGCAYAARVGLAAVLCRPEQVGEAAKAVEGSSVKVVTALGYHDPLSARTPPSDLVVEAQRLARDGADQVSVMAAPGTVDGASTDLLLHQVEAVHDSLGDAVGVRVLLNCDGMNDEAITEACRGVAEVGASTVQAGSIRGDRTSFTRLETMRKALPQPVLLKWTQPVRSLEALLVCVALGIDLFNGNPEGLIISAERAATLGPLTVPLPGLDF